MLLRLLRKGTLSLLRHRRCLPNSLNEFINKGEILSTDTQHNNQPLTKILTGACYTQFKLTTLVLVPQAADCSLRSVRLCREVLLRLLQEVFSVVVVGIYVAVSVVIPELSVVLAVSKIDF